MDKANGRYVEQPGGFRAYVPNPLPPSGLILSDVVQNLLSKADRALGRLDGALAIVPDVDRFVSMFVLREAVLSSQIEGTYASVSDVLEHEARVAPAPVESIDIQEVLNYVEATNRGIELLKTLPLSGRLVREVHAVLMHNVRGGEPSKTPGEFRRSQNWIGGATPASARFVPPPADEVSPAFRELEKFMNDERLMLPPLITAGLIHAQFETIHPFLDGNGRTGRLLIIFWLIDQRILSVPALYPSLYMKREQEEYVRRLDDIRENNDWLDWLGFFLDAIATAAQEATEIALAIVQLHKAHTELVARDFGKRTANALRLLDLLYQHPIVEAKFVEDKLALTQPTVSSMLNEFERLGLVDETTGGQRNRKFSYSAYLKLFPDVDVRS